MFINTPAVVQRNVNYTITVETKPGRYRVTMDQMTVDGRSAAGYPVPTHPLPFRPHVPDNLSQIKVSKTQMSVYQEEMVFHSDLQYYVKDVMDDLKKAMQQAGKKDW